jgi:hypothetical protein
MVKQNRLFSISFIEQDIEQQRDTPGKSFAEIQLKCSCLPKGQSYCQLENHCTSLQTSPLALMPAWAILGDHTGKMTF